MGTQDVTVDRPTRASAIAAALDRVTIRLQDGAGATLRIFAVHQAAMRWWVQYELLVGQGRRLGMVAVARHESADRILDQISTQASACAGLRGSDS
jgi:hypothetical protein